MAISTAKLVPRAIALAAVGYCIWPSLNALVVEPESKPPAKLPEVAALLASPALPPCPTRNPFARRTPAKPALPGGSSPATARAATKGEATKHVNSAAANAAAKAVDALSGLKLEATCIVGNQRMAVINGRLYAAPAMLPASGKATPTLKVVGVLPYKVLFECEGKTLELTYSNTVSRAASSRAADASAKPGKSPRPPDARKPEAASPGAKPGDDSRISGARKQING
jgi:hypothetical protein